MAFCPSIGQFLMTQGARHSLYKPGPSRRELAFPAGPAPSRRAGLSSRPGGYFRETCPGAPGGGGSLAPKWGMRGGVAPLNQDFGFVCLWLGWESRSGWKLRQLYLPALAGQDFSFEKQVKAQNSGRFYRGISYDSCEGLKLFFC